MWQEWLATLVPFAVAALLGLVLLQRISQRSPRLSRMLPKLRWPKRRPRPVRPLHSPTQRKVAPGGRPELARVFTMRERMNAGITIGFLLFAAVGVALELQQKDPAWRGLTLIMSFLFGIPVVLIGALANGAAITVALRSLDFRNYPAVALVGAAVGMSLELFACRGVLPLGGYIPGWTPNLFTPAAMILPIAMGIWGVATEVLLYARASRR